MRTFVGSSLDSLKVKVHNFIRKYLENWKVFFKKKKFDKNNFFFIWYRSSFHHFIIYFCE